MLVKLISVLAAISAVSASNPTKDPPQSFFLSENNLEYSVGMQDKTGCTIDKFLSDGSLCLDSKLIKEEDLWKKVGSFGEKQFKTLLGYYSGIQNTKYEDYLANPNGLATYANKIGAKENSMANFANNHEVVSKILAHMKGKDMVPIKDSLLTILSSDKVNGRDFVEILNKIGNTSGLTSLLKEKPNEFISIALARRKDIKYEDISLTVLKLLFANKEQCTSINTDFLNMMAMTEEHGKLIKPECIKDNENLSKMVCNLTIRNWPSAVFSHIKDMHPSCYKLMTASQLATLGSSVTEDEDICASYPLEQDTILANGSQMTPRCFAKALEQYSENNPNKINNGWTNLKDNIITKVHSDSWNKLVGASDSSTAKHFPASHKAHFFTNIDDCSKIPEGVLAYHADVTISNDCFKEMDAVNQVGALMNGAHLSADVLAHLEADKVKDWKYDEATGLAVLDLLQHRRDLRAIVKELGEKVDTDNHPCASVATLEELNKMRVLQLFGSEKCFKALPEGVFQGITNIAQIKDLEETAQHKFDLSTLIENMNDSSYSALDVSGFNTFQRGNICEHMSASNFSNLPEEVHKIISAKCMAQFTFLPEFTKEMLNDVPASAFAELDSEKFGKIPHEAMSLEQWGHAGSGLGDLSKHPATAWTKETASKLSASDMHHIHQSAYSAAPTDFFSGLSKEAFAAIPADHMNAMKIEKLNALSTEARAALTEAQARHLPVSTLDAFKDDSTSSEVKSVIAELQKNPSGEVKTENKAEVKVEEPVTTPAPTEKK